MKGIKMKQSKSTNKKQLAVISGTHETGKELAKKGYTNAFVMNDIYTSQHGKVSTAILYTDGMDEDSAKKILEGWWINTAGNKFASWQPIDQYEEGVISNNFRLSESNQRLFLIDLMKMLGLEDLTKKAIIYLANKADSGNPTGALVKDLMKEMGLESKLSANQ